MFGKTWFRRSLPGLPRSTGADVMNDGGRCSDEHDQGGDRDDKKNMHHQQDTKQREVRASNSPEPR